MRNVSGIYLITVRRPDGAPLYYVGQSINISRRCSQHRMALRSGRHSNPRMQNCWSAYGPESFSFEELEECDVDRLDEYESWWLIEFSGSRLSLNVLDRPTISWRGKKHSDQHRANIGAARRGEKHYSFGRALSESHRAAISAGGKGVGRADITRSRISAATKGEKNAMFGRFGSQNPKSRAVIATCLESGRIVHYESATLAEKNGFNQGAISRACSGKQKYHKGFSWRFADVT